MYFGTGPRLTTWWRGGEGQPFTEFELSPQLVADAYPWIGEAIIDDKNASSDNSRRERYCKHTRDVNDIHFPEVAYGLPLIDRGHWWTQARPAADSVSSAIASSMSMYSALDRCKTAVDGAKSSLPTFANTNLEQRRAYAYGQMAPKVGQGFSLLNFVYELKDFKPLFRAFQRAKRFFDLKDLVWNPKQSAVKNAANRHLETTFGYVPFARDVASIWKTMWGLHDQLLWLERNVGKIVRSHYRYSYPYTPIDWGWNGKLNSTEAGRWSPVNNGWFPNSKAVGWRYHIRYSEPPTYHSTMVYRYQMTGTQGLRRTVLSFLKAFGLEINPAVIWNAIPFSFVVDWFHQVGPWLENLTLDNLGLKLEVMDMSHSLRWSVAADLYADTWRYKSGGLIPLTVHAASMTRSYYERVPTFPGKPTLFDADGLNIERSLLGASMFIAGRR